MPITSTVGEADLGPIFAALADPTRRAILAQLDRGPATVGELAAPFAMSAPAVSRHLKVLEAAGLMRRDVVGRVHHCHSVPEPLRDAEAWLRERHEFWDRRLAALGDFLDGDACHGD
jgi:DNA-binding transcriptional ArsR family regulator